MKTGIFILSNYSNKSNLQNCLYYLFKNYNAVFKHPVYIMGNFDNKQKSEIISGIREECKNLINFTHVVFNTPDYISREKLEKCLDMNITVDWNNLTNRHIENFWMFDFWEKIGKDFDYVFRLNDDCFIDEPIKEDYFKIIDNRGYNMLCCYLQKTCPIGSFGMKDFFVANFQDNKDKVEQCMIKSTIADTSSLNNFKKLYNVVLNKEFKQKELEIHEPVVCMEGFMVLRKSFFMGNKVKPYLEKIKELGYVYYFNWKMNSLYSMLAMMLNSDKIGRTLFKLSNTNTRYGDTVPDKYSMSGCCTNK